MYLQVGKFRQCKFGSFIAQYYSIKGFYYYVHTKRIFTVQFSNDEKILPINVIKKLSEKKKLSDWQQENEKYYLCAVGSLKWTLICKFFNLKNILSGQFCSFGNWTVTIPLLGWKFEVCFCRPINLALLCCYSCLELPWNCNYIVQWPG